MATPQEKARLAKQLQEWREAENRRQVAEASQGLAVITAGAPTDLAAALRHMEDLKRGGAERRKRRTDADSHKAALRAASSETSSVVTGTGDSANDIDETLNLLDDNCNYLCQSIRLDDDIPEDIRDQLEFTLLKNFAQVLASLRAQVAGLKNHLSQLREVPLKVVASGAFILTPNLDDPPYNIDWELDQLTTNYGTLSYTIDSELSIPKHIRDEVSKLLHITAKSHIGRVREKVNWLKNRLRESRNLEETEAMSTARAAILYVTQQLVTFNRQIRIPTKTTTFKTKNEDDNTATSRASHSTIVPTFEWESSKFSSADSLSFNELLTEFKIAAESPIKYVEIANSLREQLRVATASQWAAERDTHDAKRVTNEALLRLSLAQGPSKALEELQDNYSTLLLHLKECHNRGEERRLEIVRLRKLLRNAGSAPKPARPPRPPRSKDSDKPFTREEARALFKSLEDYMEHSAQYQQIIKKLEKQLIDFAAAIDPTDTGRHQKDFLILLNSLQMNIRARREEQDECAKAKKRLQDQIKSLKVQGTTYQNLNVEMLRPIAESEVLQATPTDSKVHPATLRQYIDQNNHLRGELAKLNLELDVPKDQIHEQNKLARASQSEQLKYLQEELAHVKATSNADQVEALQQEVDRLKTELAAHEAEAKKIINDVKLIPNIVKSRIEFTTLAEAFKHLQEEWQKENMAFENYVKEVGPDYDGVRQQHDNADQKNTNLNRTAEQLQRDLDNANADLNDTNAALHDVRQQLRDCTLPLSLIHLRILDNEVLCLSTD